MFFSVMRSPWELIRSWYGYCFLAVEEYAMTLRPELLDRCREFTNHDFNWYVKNVVIEGLADYPGYWSTYCGDAVSAYLYEDDPFVKISRWLGVPLKLNKENETQITKPGWDQGSIDIVSRHCCDDIVRFGYSAPMAT
jgi:hypothetical protein